MADLSNTEIIHQLYSNFASGNIREVKNLFHKDIVWIRPGEPEIPFAGVFKGLEGLDKMFAILTETIRLKSFVPEKFCVNENTVVVLGTDTAEVIATGKTYASDWVQAFTLSEGKIIHVHAYLDTLIIAQAFHS